MWPYPDEVDEGVVDVGAAGQEEAAAGAELVEEEELLLLRGGLGKTSPRGDAGIRAPKNPGLFFFSRAQNPGFCQGLTRPMRRWSRRAAASCARCQASSSWVLGKATAATRCSERRSVGSPQKAAELCGERREQKGRGAASGNPDGWVPDQPRVPRPAELTVSTRRAPISPVCPRRGPRQSCSRGPHLRGWQTDKRTWQMDRRTQQAAASPPCPKQPTDVTRDTRCSPIDGGRGGRHLLLDALQLEAVVLGGGARRVAEVSASSERDVLGEGTPEGGVSP